MLRIQPIILAAGLSTRFERGHKLNYPWHGHTMLNHCIETITLVNELQSPIVVANHHTLEFVEIQYRELVIINSNAKHGMLASIKCGLQANLAAHSDSIMICLADMPYLTSSDIISFLRYSDTLPEGHIVFPQTTKGRKGHPTLIPSRFREEILQLPAMEGGLKRWLTQKENLVSPFVTKNSNYFHDIDHCKDIRTEELPDVN